MVKPVMITGAGIVSAIGCGKAETLDSLLHQRTGIGKLRYLQTEHREYPVGEVKLSDEEMKRLLGIDSEPTTRSILLGMLAVREALEEDVFCLHHVICFKLLFCQFQSEAVHHHADA